MGESGRSYTITEANGLIPQLRSVVIQLGIAKRRLDAAVASLDRLADDADGDGAAAEVERREAEIDAMGEEVKALVAHLNELGVEVRDIETGLVDIPGERDGRRVWLCWRLAEPDVAHWHPTDQGFSARQPW